MYIKDLLPELEKALGLEPGTDAAVSERETAVLAEIGRLRADLKECNAAASAERPKRMPAANAKRLNEVKRDVAMDMLYGQTARAMATKYGISEDQARRVAAQEIRWACRSALGRREGQAGFEVATLDWIQSSSNDKVLGRARSGIGTVKMALEESWAHQDQDTQKGKV